MAHKMFLQRSKNLPLTRRFSSSSAKDQSQLRDIILNYIPVQSHTERLKLLLEFSVKALQDPTRGDYVSFVGDLSASPLILKQIQRRMMSHPDGKMILQNKPRVTDQTWNQKELLSLPPNTFGFQYATWMSKFQFRADERPCAKYVADLEHAYIIQRYREIHDTLHTLLGYGINVSEEIALKWFEMVQIGLPSTALSAFFGPLNLLLIERDLKQLSDLGTVFLPHILSQAHTAEFFMNVYFEKHFATDIDELRFNLGMHSIERQTAK